MNKTRQSCISCINTVHLHCYLSLVYPYYMWILFSFISAFSETTKDVVGKKSTHATNEYITSFSLHFFASIIFIPFVLWKGVPELSSLYWLATAGVFITIPAWSILYMKAIKLSPLSVSVPMLAFNPVLTALLSIVLGKDIPSILGWVGILLVTVGIYLIRFDISMKHKGILYPFKSILHEPGALAMLGVALIWSIGAHLSKLGVTSSSALFFAFTQATAAAIILYIIARIKSSVTVMSGLKQHFKSLFSLGLLNAIGDFAMTTALSTGITPYVISLKRTNILWSSLMGKLFFRERINVIKTTGLLIMFTGVVMIIVG